MAGHPTALVTGASSGIGAAIARQLATRRHDLVLVARTEPALHALAGELRTSNGIEATVLATDLARVGAGRELARELATRELSVDVLVNNAGFADFAKFADADLDKLTQMINLNITTLTELTHELVAPMIAQGNGRVLNVASTAAFMPGPLMAVYYATKAYVLSFSEALAQELRPTGVTLTVLCPGPTETGFQARAAMEDSKLVKGRKIMDAETVARLGIDALMAGKPVVIPGLKNKLQATAPRYTPRRLMPAIVMRLQATTHR
jgi:short-subunit dehydrogenase